MVNYHPDLHILTEFSAGSLSPAVAVCVSAHLDYCPQCRAHVQKLEALGSAVLEQSTQATAPETLYAEGELDTALEKTLAVIDELPATDELPTTKASNTENAREDILPGTGFLPTIVKQLTQTNRTSLRWKKISAALSTAHLKTADKHRELALYQLHAGGGVAEHDHRGEEITVVLCGSFSDENGLYLPGDFLVKQPGEAHSPKASKDGDCICLSALAAPVRFAGVLTRLLNPFIQLKPSAS